MNWTRRRRRDSERLEALIDLISSVETTQHEQLATLKSLETLALLLSEPNPLAPLMERSLSAISVLLASAALGVVVIQLAPNSALAFVPIAIGGAYMLFVTGFTAWESRHLLGRREAIRRMLDAAAIPSPPSKLNSRFDSNGRS